jgi:hypothetical protein
MKPLNELQQLFCDALRTSESPAQALLDEIVDDGFQLQRFNVYRNNFIVLNGDALADMYPVIKQLVGDEAFRSLATAYVRKFPPMERTLLFYGEEFADFLASLPELSALPYLSDVARLEYAWSAAYHAEDVAPLTQQQLADYPPEALENLRLRPHPSMCCIDSTFPIYRIWLLNQSATTNEIIALDEGGSHVVVIRPGLEVEVREHTPGALIFLRRLACSDTIAEAYTRAADKEPGFDLNSFFSRYLFDGTFCV